jgi:hypothetical protein
MRAKDLPEGLPLDPNARQPNTNKRVYQDVEQSLLGKEGEPGTFHLKNKGITIVAQSVRAIGEDLEVKMKKGRHGIVDGGHTYTIIRAQHDAVPDDQYVLLDIRTGIPEEWIVEIAGGLNTSVQVQDMSLDNLMQRFDWIKKELTGTSYYDTIAWSENDKGDYDARDIVSLLMMFNTEQFPNDGNEHPVAAYEKKSTALKLFEEAEGKSGSFEKLRPILKDILVLHDTVAHEARTLWNQNVPGGKGGSLSFIDSRDRGFRFHFINKVGSNRLVNGALYPILGAFRWYVELPSGGKKAKWRGGFNRVLEAWRSDGAELLKATKQMSDELSRNPNAIGKSRPHWGNLHTIVAKRDLMRRAK